MSASTPNSPRRHLLQMYSFIWLCLSLTAFASPIHPREPSPTTTPASVFAPQVSTSYSSLPLQKRSQNISSSSSTASHKKSLKSLFRDEAEENSQVRKRDSGAFCVQFQTACSSLCSSNKLKTKAQTCQRDYALGAKSSYRFQCKCGSTDYTAKALALTKPTSTNKQARAVKEVITTSVRTVTVTTTRPAASWVTSLKSVTSWVAKPISTQSIVKTTVLPVQTVVRTTTTSAAPTTRLTTVVSTLPMPTVVITKTQLATPMTTTSVKVVTAPAATVYRSRKRDGQLDDVEEVVYVAEEETNNSAPMLLRRQSSSTFCARYATSCSSQCTNNRGVGSQSCNVQSTNVYVISCTCKDGTIRTKASLDNLPASASSSTTTTTITSLSTTSRITTKTVAVTSTTMSLKTVTSTSQLAPVTSYTTKTLSPSSTAVSTQIVTASASSTIVQTVQKTVAASSTTTQAVQTTLSPSVVTILTTSTVTPLTTVAASTITSKTSSSATINPSTATSVAGTSSKTASLSTTFTSASSTVSTSTRIVGTTASIPTSSSSASDQMALSSSTKLLSSTTSTMSTSALVSTLTTAAPTTTVVAKAASSSATSSSFSSASTSTLSTPSTSLSSVASASTATARTTSASTSAVSTVSTSTISASASTASMTSVTASTAQTTSTANISSSSSSSASASSTSASPVSAQSTSLPAAAYIGVTDAASGEFYGLVSNTNNEYSYSLTLSPDGSAGAVVSVNGAVTSASSLVSLQMSNGPSDAYPLLGLETQTVSDVGLYPTSTEFLLVTNVGSSQSGSAYPDSTASDSQVYLAESIVWSVDVESGALTPIWQNPQGSNPLAAQLQLFMLCLDSGLDDCFLTAASDQSTFDNFDTDGVSINRVQFALLAAE